MKAESAFPDTRSDKRESLGQQENRAKALLIGLNLGKNKTSPEFSTDDYIQGLAEFANIPIVDYFVINVSSPNTPGLRKLQAVIHLDNLLSSISSLKSSGVLPFDKPVLLKISPDLSHNERKEISRVLITRNQSFEKTSGRNIIDGIIVSNTTVSRPDIGDSISNSPEESVIHEAGGLSGAPLKTLSTESIRDMYTLMEGKIPIIGVGGIFTGRDAYEKITAGASLVQVYTAFAFEGPPVVTAIKRDLAQLLQENGYNCVSEAVGADHQQRQHSRS
jgi:dihydroorotate dehydrogenase